MSYHSDSPKRPKALTRKFVLVKPDGSSIEFKHLWELPELLQRECSLAPHVARQVATNAQRTLNRGGTHWHGGIEVRSVSKVQYELSNPGAGPPITFAALSDLPDLLARTWGLGPGDSRNLAMAASEQLANPFTTEFRDGELCIRKKSS